MCVCVCVCVSQASDLLPPPTPCFPFGNREFAFDIRMSVSVFGDDNCICFIFLIRLHVRAPSFGVGLSLSDPHSSLRMTVSRSVRVAADGTILFFYG